MAKKPLKSMIIRSITFKKLSYIICGYYLWLYNISSICSVYTGDERRPPSAVHVGAPSHPSWHMPAHRLNGTRRQGSPQGVRRVSSKAGKPSSVNGGLELGKSSVNGGL